MKIESMLNFDDDSFYPQELYVDGDYLVAIGNIMKMFRRTFP